MRKVLMAVLGMASISIYAETYKWTGAQDEYWTNRLNWVDSGNEVASRCPGVAKSGDNDTDWANFATENATALFEGAVMRTAINLDGLHSISNVIVRGADTPQIVFGTGLSQKFPLRLRGVFSVAASVVNMPRINSIASLGEGCTYTSWNASNYAQYENKATGELFLAAIGSMDTPPSFTGSWHSPRIIFAGSGPFRIDGGVMKLNNRPASSLIYINFSTTGKITVGGPMPGIRSISLGGAPEIEIEEGAYISFYYQDPDGFTSISKDCRFTGKGELRFTGTSTHKDRTRVDFDTSPATVKHLTVECVTAITNTYSLGRAKDHTIRMSGPGVLEFKGEMRTAGAFIVPGKSVLAAASIGADGEKTNLGSGTNVILSAGGTLKYTGTGETTTRTIVLTNVASAAGTLLQGGTGPWTVASDIVQYGDSVATALTLSNGTAQEATLNTVLGAGFSDPSLLSLAKTDSGLWRLAAVNTFGGTTTVSAGTLAVGAAGSIASSSCVTVAAGATLLFEKSGSGTVSQTLAAVKATGGATTVTVEEGVTLNLQDMPALENGGTLNFDVRAGARVMCVAGIGSAAPAGVTVNGVEVTFAADGRMRPVDGYSATVEIPARGGVLADNAGGITGITTDGDTGPITLAADSVEVGALVQKAFADATVSMSGKTLAASTFARTATSGAFTVGTVSGEGAVSSDALTLDNADNVQPLTVNATFASQGDDNLLIRKIGAGAAELTDLQGKWAITNEQGRLTVSGSSRASVSVRLTNAVDISTFEVAGDACMTGSVSMGYSSSKASSFRMRNGYFERPSTFLVEGCMEVFGGHFVANALNVGRYAYATYVQHGGEVKVGANGTTWLSSAGAVGIASSLRIKGGTMTCKSDMATGGTSSQHAKVTVEGGELVVNGIVYVGANNWGHGWFNFNGGVAEVQTIRNHRNVAWYNGNQGRFYISFNGGTVRLRNNGLAVFGRPVVSDTDYYPARLVTVCEKGAIIDTNGKTGNTIDVPISKPTGQGIVSIPLSAPITGLSGAPYVSITDANSGAMGASAECDYDAASGSVTNITVTSPGVNYTSAKAALRYGSGNLKTGIACTFGEIVGGSFTKAGLGDLTLNATNTWSGGTVVSGGVLVCGCDWALPTNTAVRIAGGTLDLNGKQALISSLEVVPNAGATLKGATSGVLPASIAVAGDVQALRGHSLRLLSVPDGFPDGVPAVTSNDDDPHWKAELRNGLLRLVWMDGFSIIIR